LTIFCVWLVLMSWQVTASMTRVHGHGIGELVLRARVGRRVHGCLI
jgi:hypothetical protein